MRMDGWTAGWLAGWLDELMHRCMNEWMAVQEDLLLWSDTYLTLTPRGDYHEEVLEMRKHTPQTNAASVSFLDFATTRDPHHKLQLYAILRCTDRQTDR